MNVKDFKRTIWYFVVIFLIPVALTAQDKDSLIFTAAKFESQKIAPGIFLKSYHFNHQELFGTNQNISILEVKPKKRNRFFIGYERKELKPVAEIAAINGAVAGINATFFDMKEGGSIDYIRSEGKVITENRLSADGQRDKKHQMAAIVIRKGKVAIKRWDGSENWEQHLEGEDVMTIGPLLFLDGQQEQLDSTDFVLTRHPRSVIAKTKRNMVLLITVDGRHVNSSGMSLFELSKVMKWLRVSEAINLDGGGSTTLWVKGQSDNGVVNYPSDNKKWDHYGERGVASALLLKNK